MRIRVGEETDFVERSGDCENAKEEDKGGDQKRRTAGQRKGGMRSTENRERS